MAVFLMFSVLYLIGFLPPLFTSNWRALGMSFVVTVLIYGLLVLPPSLEEGSGFGMAGIAIAVFLMVSVIGLLSGHIARAFTLSMRWPNRSRPAIITVIVAPFIAPAAIWTAFSISSHYNQKRSSEIYAALPTAETLPPIAACEPFRKTGALLSAILIPDERGSREMPERETRLVYPAAYVDYRKPSYPTPDMRRDQIDLKMRIQDFQPVADNKDPSIPLSDRAPTVRFRFSQEIPLDRHLAIRLDWEAYRARPDEPLKIETAASPYPGLLEVTAPPRSQGQPTTVTIDSAMSAALERGSANSSYATKMAGFPFPIASSASIRTAYLSRDCSGKQNCRDGPRSVITSATSQPAALRPARAERPLRDGSAKGTTTACQTYRPYGIF